MLNSWDFFLPNRAQRFQSYQSSYTCRTQIRILELQIVYQQRSEALVGSKIMEATQQVAIITVQKLSLIGAKFTT